jgi:hypothetical protein
MTSSSGSLFDPVVPPGFRYQGELISQADEVALAEAIGSITLSTFEMRGVAARRRVAFFGESYEGREATPLPSFLLPLRATVGGWANVDPAAFAMVLINEYRPGTPIGWHRDAPRYDLVAGVSLLSSCRMKFRPYVRPGAVTSSAARRVATHEIALDPRSAYLMSAESRSEYEHHIPAVRDLRYSITFRTLRSSVT